MSKKFRLQFDITLEALQQLDDLKERVGAKTRAEVIKNALRLYDSKSQTGDIIHDICQLQEDVSSLLAKLGKLEARCFKEQ